jgi:hypothetical protein
VAEERAARYREVFAVGAFRAVWCARLLSTAGDQVARVALSVLVLERTRSVALAALSFALSFLPALFGSLLAGLADRYPWRSVSVWCDVVRAVLMGLMAVPVVPLPVTFVLLFATQLLASPSNAAQGALLADVLPGDLLVVGQSARSIVDQVAQIGGFAFSGVLTAVLTPNGALAVNAASFVASAVLVRAGVPGGGRSAGPAGGAAGGGLSLWASTRRGARLVWSDRRLRALVGLVWMIGLPVAAEGLAVPYAQSGRFGTAAAGWLLAATPAGAVLGAAVLGRVPPGWRERLLGPLAAASGLPLAAASLRPGLVVSCVLFGLSGVGAAYMVVAPALFIQATPAEGRGQAIGLMSSGAVAAQGVCIALAGVLAGELGAAAALGVAGVAAAAAGVLLGAYWRGVRRAVPASETEGDAVPVG